MAYQLQSGKLIDEEALCAALDDHAGLTVAFFDTETGAVTTVPPEEVGRRKCIEANLRYRRVPAVPVAQKCAWIFKMTELMFDEEDLPLITEIVRACADNAHDAALYDRLCARIAKDPNGWDSGWAQWHADHIGEEMREFLHAVDPAIEDIWEGDDGCAVCDAMRAANERGRSLDEKELRAAFATANVFQSSRQNSDTKEGDLPE